MPLQSMSHFKAFRMTVATIKAISIREAEKAKKHSFDQCWVVFDKDYPNSDF